MAELDIQPVVDLVDYVHTMLNQGLTFKKVAEALNIKDPRQLKRLMTKALGYKFKVYGSFTVEELSDRIQAILPIGEHGANWGILHIKAALTRLNVRLQDHCKHYQVSLNMWNL
jgi:hypothetical protein